ncbi:MAG: flavodoxin, partial [Clostridia bacterium]|nr:flavodoxin [Clostridia bacterium]
MKFLAIVKSKHLGNTMQIAEAMAEAAPLTVAELSDLKYYNISEYDIVGFGGGIYYGKHDKELLEYVKKADNLPKYAFVFSTSGTGSVNNNKALIAELEAKGIKILGNFACKALDRFFIFKIGGGINKGHPDETDFDNAQSFIQGIVKA